MTGERSPDEVFADFVVAFDRILEHADDWYQDPRPASTGSYRAFKVPTYLYLHGLNVSNLNKPFEIVQLTKFKKLRVSSLQKFEAP